MRLLPENSDEKLMYIDNMSDDDRDIDIESDDDLDDKSIRHSGNATQFVSQAEKRAHHNALERKRRDHIKDSFSSLRDAVPSLQGEKVVSASRAQILKKAAEYIQFMRRKNQSHQQDIEDLKRQNDMLEAQIKKLEQQKNNLEENGGELIKNDTTDTETSDYEDNQFTMQNKKIKSSSYV